MFPPLLPLLLIVFVVFIANYCSVASFSSLPSSTSTSSSSSSSSRGSCRSTKSFGARPLPITSTLLKSRRTSIIHSSSNTALASSSFSSAASSSSSLLQLHDESLRPGIAAINAALPTLLPLLNQLRNAIPYFRLYSIDMLASCNYFPQELFECYTESCEVYPTDDTDVPANIRIRDFNEYEFELDGWARWDMPTEDYYDIVGFPEDYTGYDGSDVWKFIHERIEFKKETKTKTTATASTATATTTVDDDGITHWKADFNKAISGLHAMVSAQVVRGMMDRINSSSSSGGGSGGGGGGGGQLDPNKYMWTNPTNEYHRRLGPNGTTPRAIENMYFTAMLLLSGIRAVRDQLLLDCDAGQIGSEDDCTTLRSILYHPLLDDASVDAASIRLREHVLQDINNNSSGGGLWEARMRSRDLLRIMNCVQCNKCRFHGKIAALGLTTAFNLVIGGDRCSGVEDVTSVHRVELAALLTSLAKFTSGIDLCLEMQQQEQQQSQ